MDKNYSIYCITMKSNSDRVKNVLKQKKIINDLHIFDAINVQNWEKEQVLEIYKDYVDVNTLKNVTKGAIGCYISHLKLYELFEKSKKDYMIVLEDDFKVKDNFYKNIEQLLVDLPSNFDFVYIYYDKIYYKKSLSKFKTTKTYKKCEPMYQTLGYIISKKFLKKFDKKKKIKKPIDNELMEIMKNKKVNYYASNDTLIDNQGLGYTTNNKFKSLIHWTKYFIKE